jgi:hypothetical protein
MLFPLLKRSPGNERRAAAAPAINAVTTRDVIRPCRLVTDGPAQTSAVNHLCHHWSRIWILEACSPEWKHKPGSTGVLATRELLPKTKDFVLIAPTALPVFDPENWSFAIQRMRKISQKIFQTIVEWQINPLIVLVLGFLLFWVFFGVLIHIMVYVRMTK